MRSATDWSAAVKRPALLGHAKILQQVHVVGE